MKYLYVSPEKCSFQFALTGLNYMSESKASTERSLIPPILPRKWHFMSEKGHSQASECGIYVYTNHGANSYDWLISYVQELSIYAFL